jgi:hypothetical protein
MRPAFRTESGVVEDESWTIAGSAVLSNTVPRRTFRWYAPLSAGRRTSGGAAGLTGGGQFAQRRAPKIDDGWVETALEVMAASSGQASALCQPTGKQDPSEPGDRKGPHPANLKHEHRRSKSCFRQI